MLDLHEEVGRLIGRLEGRQADMPAACPPLLLLLDLLPLLLPLPLLLLLLLLLLPISPLLLPSSKVRWLVDCALCFWWSVLRGGTPDPTKEKDLAAPHL